MSALNQKTIKNPVLFNGIGLHSGKIVHLEIKPARPNSGIVFKRIDLNSNNIIYPNFLNVTNTSLNNYFFFFFTSTPSKNKKQK